MFSLNNQASVSPYASQVIAGVDARLEYEASKGSMTQGNRKAFFEFARLVCIPEVEAMLIDAGVSPDFVNRAINSNARTNVYTLDKVRNAIAFAHSKANSFNKMNKFIFLTSQKFATANESMTREDAKTAISKDNRIEPKRKALFVQLPEIKSTGTQAAQSSSTLDAFTLLGVFKVEKTLTNKDLFSLDTENVFAKAIAANVAAQS